MIGRDEAIAICEERFPAGLDHLIELLSVRVDRSDIGDVDGWCYHLPDGNRVVRPSAVNTKERQRFTLAHELAHFILDGPRRRLTIIRDVYNPKSPEERKVDALASLLLLPTERVKEFIGRYAIDYWTIKRLKNKARVSDIVVALRLARAADDFGLDRPTVVWFKDGQIEKWFPAARRVNRPAITSLFEEATESPEHMATKKSVDGTIAIASLLPNANYPTLFYYHTSPRAARRSPRAEDLKALEEKLFRDDDSFRTSLNGCIGGYKKTLLEMEVIDRVEVVIERFIGNYSQRPPEHIVKVKSQ